MFTFRSEEESLMLHSTISAYSCCTRCCSLRSPPPPAPARPLVIRMWGRMPVRKSTLAIVSSAEASRRASLVSSGRRASLRPSLRRHARSKRAKEAAPSPQTTRTMRSAICCGASFSRSIRAPSSRTAFRLERNETLDVFLNRCTSSAI